MRVANEPPKESLSLDAVVGLVLAAGILVLGALAGQVSNQNARERQQTDVARATVEFQSAAAAAVDHAVGATQELARSTVEARRNVGTDAALLDAVTVTRSTTGRRRASGELAGVGDPTASADLLGAMDLARDSAATVVSGPAGDAGIPVVVVPVFRLADGSRSLLPDTSGIERRGTVDSWRLASIDLDGILAAGTAATARDGLGVRITDGADVLISQGDPDVAASTGVIHVAPRQWTLTVGAERGVAIPSRTWGLVGFAIALAAGLVALVATVESGRRRERREHAVLAAQMQLLSEVAPVVQRSLDLTDVLPAVAVRLMDDLELSGVSCWVTAEGGESVELFAAGQPVDADIPAQLELPAVVGAGQTIALALQRGGRSVGELRARTGQHMDVGSLQVLASVADLAAAAIVNARLFEQQQAAVERLQEVDELKTVFLGTASHELRTPVAAIVGFAKLLETGWDNQSEEQRRLFAERIVFNARALNRLVQDLLDFARLERGGLRIASEPIDLAAVVPTLVAEIGAAHPDHVVVATVAEPDLQVLGDDNAVERILSNLVSNAAKYSPKGTTIQVEVRRDGDSVLVTVDDEGPGVSAADRERIFSRFFRGFGDEVVRTRGVGIGLSLVREFAAQMRGEVSVDTSPAGGARFLVRIPQADETAGSDTGGRPAVAQGAGGTRGGEGVHATHS